MPQTEREPNFISPDQYELYEQSRRERRHKLGEHAISSFSILPEIQSGFESYRHHLQSRVIGQEAAIDAIVDALDRTYARAPSDMRPVANLAFLGPTGVGKTETAKALSEVLSSDMGLIRIDCSNFSHGHEVASLIGAPPGYVGREQPPILSQSRIGENGSVILFDEIEKGSEKLFNLLLQIMDNGQLELNNGKIVSFRDSVIVLTSNLGAKEMAREAEGGRIGFGNDDSTTKDRTVIEKAALKSFKEFFKPEFINRLDNTVVFHSLNESQLHDVLEVKLNEMNSSYADDYGVYLSLSEAVRRHLVQQALREPAYGVRPLVRALDKDIGTSFGRYIAHSVVTEGTELRVHHRDEFKGRVPDTYTSELIFASRPDHSVKKKFVPPPIPQAVFMSGTSTALVKVSDPSPDDEDYQI